MAVDTPGPPDDGDRSNRRDGWDYSAGRIAALEREQPFGSRAEHRAAIAAVPEREAGRAPDRNPERDPERRAEILREIFTDENGNYIGEPGRRKDKRVLPEDQLIAKVDVIRELFGEPDQAGQKQNGIYETWWISKTDPRSTVTYRRFSESGGRTLDFNNVRGFEDLDRYHISDDGRD